MDLEAIQTYREEQQRQSERKEELGAVYKSSIKVAQAVDTSSVTTQRSLQEVKNALKEAAKSGDVAELADSVNTLVISDHVAQQKVVAQLEDLNDSIRKLPIEYPDFPDFPEIPVPPSDVSVKNLKEVTDWLQKVVGAIGKIEVAPVVNVDVPKIEPAKVNVEAPNLEPLLKAIKAIDLKKTPDIKIPDNSEAFEALQKAIDKVTTSIKSLQFPVPNYVIPFSQSGKGTQVTLTSTGAVPVDIQDAEIIVTPAKATDAYGISAISDDGTYKYFFFENATPDYYVMRKTSATSVFAYTKGTGSYTAVYQSAILGPSGSPTWATYGATF